jgi:hypothetical protein
MASDATVKVEGLQRLVATLGRAAIDVEDMKAAHAEAGRIVAADATPRAPRVSGALAGSVRPARQARRARIMAGGARVPYAGPIHWGWNARHIRPHPFISWAAQATEPQWAEGYRRDVVRALSHVKGA